MKRVITVLKEMREEAERDFIDHSLILRRSPMNSPIPDVKADLDHVAELNEAISVLENYLVQKPKSFI